MLPHSEINAPPSHAAPHTPPQPHTPICCLWSTLHCGCIPHTTCPDAKPRLIGVTPHFPPPPTSRQHCHSPSHPKHHTTPRYTHNVAQIPTAQSLQHKTLSSPGPHKQNNTQQHYSTPHTHCHCPLAIATTTIVPAHVSVNNTASTTHTCSSHTPTYKNKSSHRTHQRYHTLIPPHTTHQPLSCESSQNQVAPKNNAPKSKCPLAGSNRLPIAYEAIALPFELKGLC